MERKVVHLFFHDDVDGIVSAAMVMKAFYTNHVYRLYPVKSSHRGDKFNKLVESVSRDGNNDSIVIVDYQYHPSADLWVDHHYCSDLKDERLYNGRQFYNSKAKSAARVIYDWFQETPLLKGVINQHIVDITDMIDSAGFKSIDYIFSSTEPLMLLKAYLERLSIFVDSTYCRIVELIVKYNFDIDSVLFSLGIDDGIINELQKSAKDIEKAMVIYGVMSITEMNREYAYPRYSEYLVRPDLMYSIRVIRLGGDRVKMAVSYNRWQPKSCKVDIGKLLNSIDYKLAGGGHQMVGSAVIYENDVERFIDDLCVQFNGPEDSIMEKLAVDKEDPVEKKAEEMIKTGEADNKDSARKKATSKLEGGKSERVQSGGV